MDERIARLVLALHEHTVSRHLSWQRTADEETFQTTVAGHVVTISKIESRQAGSAFANPIDTFELQLYDANGDVVDRVVTRASTGFFGADLSSSETLLVDLHNLALRSATGADEVIDSILRNLESSSPPPPPPAPPPSLP